MSKFRIYSEPSDLGRRTRLAILIEHANGRESIAGPLTFRDIDPGLFHDPEMTIDRVILPDGATQRLDGRALLQAMLDHAWEIGMRPTGQAGADTTKQVAAMSAHLEDMRALVFSQTSPVMTTAMKLGAHGE